MAGHYRAVNRDQAYLVPPSLTEWLPPEHPVFFVIEVIEDMAPKLRAFHRRKALGGSGRAMYDPMMLVTLLVYASWQGVRSSRQIEARCHTDVAFRIICAQDPPDHSTISRFRKLTARAFVDLFAEVLLLCAREGMGQFGKVAIDGTKIAANASRSANVTLERVRQIARAEVDAGLAADADADSDADAPPPPGLRDRTARKERLARVQAELEAAQAAADQAAVQRKAAAAEYAAAVVAGTNRRGRAPAGTDALALARTRYEAAQARQQAAVDDYEREKARPLQHRTRQLGAPPKPVDQAATVRHAHQAMQAAQREAATTPTNPTDTSPGTTPANAAAAKPKQAKRNLTDPDSRLMPTKDGWVQGYNAQAAVTQDHLVVAVALTDTPADTTQAVPMMHAAQTAADRITAHTGRDDTTIGIALFDAGYNSDTNLTAPGPDRLIATGKRRTQERAAATTPTSGPPPPAPPPAKRCATDSEPPPASAPTENAAPSSNRSSATSKTSPTYDASSPAA